MKKKHISSLAALAAAASLVSCATSEGTGTLAGAGAGALAGGVAGNNISGISSTEGAIGGAIIGGLIGNRMGNQQDQINAVDARANTAVVNVRNDNGSITPVQLQRIQGDIWRGPRGEQYNGMPSERQLRGAYGF